MVKLYFNYVSIPVLPYGQPPKRCFLFQRYRHASISCKRKIVCSICIGHYFHTECELTDPSLFKCVSCEGNHKASSAVCNFFKEARKISCSLQNEIFSHLKASQSYAKMYDSSKSSKSLKGSAKELITESQNVDHSWSAYQSSPHSQSPPPYLQPPSRPSSAASFISCNSNDKLLHPSRGTRNKRYMGYPTIIADCQATCFSVTGPIWSRHLPKNQNKGKQNSRTPFHKTKTYANIINGSSWNNAENSSSEEEIDLDISSCTPITPAPSKPQR